MFDDRTSRIAFELAGEALAGVPNGQLYAHRLSISLIDILSNRFAGRTEASGARSVGCFGVLERMRLLSLMCDQLGEDLPLARLATEAGMSVFHFARVFNDTFGATPHRYLLDLRLDAAVEALKRDRQ